MRDLDLRESMAAHGKTPEFVLAVAIEEAFFQEPVVGLPRHHLNDSTQGIESGERTVGPPYSRLKRERKQRKPRNVVRKRFFGTPRALRCFGRADTAADEARCMRKQVSDCDLAFRAGCREGALR